MAPHSISMTGPSSLKPTGFAEIIFTFSILLGVASMTAVGLRTWQRIRERSFFIDDGLTWLGLVRQNIAMAKESRGNDTDIGGLILGRSRTWLCMLSQHGAQQWALARQIRCWPCPCWRVPHSRYTVSHPNSSRLFRQSSYLPRDNSVFLQNTDTRVSRAQRNLPDCHGLHQSQHLQHAAPNQQWDGSTEDYLGYLAHDVRRGHIDHGRTLYFFDTL